MEYIISWSDVFWRAECSMTDTTPELDVYRVLASRNTHRAVVAGLAVTRRLTRELSVLRAAWDGWAATIDSREEYQPEQISTIGYIAFGFDSSRWGSDVPF